MFGSLGHGVNDLVVALKTDLKRTVASFRSNLDKDCGVNMTGYRFMPCLHFKKKCGAHQMERCEFLFF